MNEVVGNKDTEFVFCLVGRISVLFLSVRKKLERPTTANRWLSRASKSEEAKRKKASSRTEFEQQTNPILLVAATTQGKRRK